MTTSENTFDAIVIGSGIGGMSAAVHLANHDKRVLLLEAALDFGGYTNPFKRKKFHFDPGLHYIGELNPGDFFHETLVKLQLRDRVDFNRLDDDCYDRYVFPELDFRMPANRELLRARLEQHFPEEKSGIDKFIRMLEALKINPGDPDEMKNAFAEVRAIDGSEVLATIRKRTYGEIMDHFFGDNALIKAVLSGPCGDVGLPPGRVSAMALIGIHNHYVDGAFFPKGGSGALRDAFMDRLKEKGAVCKNRTRVKKILVEDGKVAGVVTDKDEEYRAGVVVSNVDPVLTFTELLDSEHVRAKTLKKAEGIEASYGSICFFVGTDMPPENIKLGSENIWYYPSTDIDAEYDDALLDKLPEGDFSFFLSAPSRKDPGGGKCPPGTEVMEMVLLANYAPYAKWSDQRALQRDDDYKALKQKIQSTLVAQLERTYAPGLGDHIIVSEISTPVTNTYYTSPYKGSIYGPAHTPEQLGLGRFMPRGTVKNLYLCGAGVFNCGIGPCCISGYFAADLALKDAG